jgi:MFS family permease
MSVAAREVASSRELLPLWPIYALTVALSIILIASATQLSFLLHDIGLTRPSVQSWIIGMGSAGSIIGAASYGTARLRLGVRGTFVLLMVLMGAGNVVIGQSWSAALAAIGCGIAGLGSGIATPYLCNLVFEQAAAEVRGRALGMLYAAMFLGDLLNPIVFYALNPLYGIHGSFAILGSLLVALGFASLFFRHRWAGAAG